jgi:hypothetical protein
MKFNCGPSLRERKLAANEARRQRVFKIIDEGDTIFAWLPKRTSSGTCVWLERVKRTLAGYRYGSQYRYDLAGRSRTEIHWALTINGGIPIWEYSALTEEQNGL